MGLEEDILEALDTTGYRISEAAALARPSVSRPPYNKYRNL